MASDAQIKANRQNAGKSSGPKTESGKSRASRNSLQYGFTAKTLVLWSTDDPEYWAAEQKRLLAHYRPKNIEQQMHVNSIVRARIDVHHADQLEASILSEGTIPQIAGRALITARASERGAIENLRELNNALDELNGSDESEACDKADQACSSSKDMEKSKHPDEIASDSPWLPRHTVENFVGNVAALALIQRYRARSESLLFRAMHELERARAAQQGRNLTTPAIIDVI